MTPATIRKKTRGFLRASFSPFLFGCFLFQPHRIKFTTTKKRKKWQILGDLNRLYRIGQSYLSHIRIVRIKVKSIADNITLAAFSKNVMRLNLEIFQCFTCFNSSRYCFRSTALTSPSLLITVIICIFIFSRAWSACRFGFRLSGTYR